MSLRNNTINASMTLTKEEMKIFLDNEDVVEKIRNNIKEAIHMQLEPFMEYRTEDDVATGTCTIYGRVRLCKVGKWVEIDRAPHRHKCSICQTAADDDGHVSEIITPFCPYCGAYLTNAGEIVAKRSEARP